MYSIGIDVGSTCTKAVALDEGGNLVFYKVTPTGWNCVETASGLMEDMAAQGVCRQAARVVATGYGRVSIPFADKAVTEISCHGKGLEHIDLLIHHRINTRRGHFAQN